MKDPDMGKLISLYKDATMTAREIGLPLKEVLVLLETIRQIRSHELRKEREHADQNA